jgi:hypothetical protein
MRTNYLSLTAALVCIGMAFASQLSAQRNCGSMEYLELQMQNDSKRALKMQQIELQTRQFAEQAGARAVNGVITIPVVVHVVYNTTAENISAAQIQTQIDVLNQDFRRTNSDADNVWSQAADTEIEFCLASVDPNGNPTSGITRTSTTVTAFGTNDTVKRNSTGGKDAWPAGSYMNFWVCDISGGILGYAQFPGGAAATDGVVCDYQYFGTIGTATAPFNLGRTATHEVGHYLNLRHIWGDGGCSVDDFVTDTPTSDGANYGCALGTVSCGTTDMVQNYMDYSDDACMNLYTAGQTTRMRAIFDTGGARASLLNSAACGAPPTPTCTDGIQNGQETGVDCGGPSCPTCPACTTVSVRITFDNYPEETSWSIKNSSGATVASGGTYGSQPDGSTLTLTPCLADGCYDFTITDAYGDGICCAYGNGSYAVTVGGSTVAAGGSFTTSQTTNFCIGGGPAPTCNDGIQNGSETGVDCGGSCAPCATCNDGIQNGSETGVDCGGSCAPCATCNDGIQNGSETGVDCGGSCAPCGGGGGCTPTQVNFNNFDASRGIWTDGGSDCIRTNNAAFANSGSFSIQLRDNTSSSVMTTGNLALLGYESVTIDFSYVANSMETGEDFWLQASTNGGSTYQTLRTWVSGTNFTNGSRQSQSVVITGAFNNTIRFRFRCDASANNDQVYIDDVNISGCRTNARLGGEELTANLAEVAATPGLGQVSLFPNPTKGLLNIDFFYQQALDGQVQAYVTDITGKTIQQQQWYATQGQQRQQLDVSQFAPGIYLLHLTSGSERVTHKFVVID